MTTKAKAKAEAQFKEIGRIPVSDTTAVAVSEMQKAGKLVGYTVNKHVQTAKYTGYTSGVMIPVAKVRQFVKLFPNGHKS
jgi:hypothetical protein